MYTPDDERKNEYGEYPEYSQNEVDLPYPSEPTPSESPLREAPQSEPAYDESIYYIEPIHVEPLPAEPIYTKSVNSAVSSMEPIYSATSYSDKAHYRQPYTSESYPQTQQQPHLEFAPPHDASREFTAYDKNRYPVIKPAVETKRKKRNSSVGGFLKAACLVLVCALISAASSYLVMEYRQQRGDFIQTQQVVLGSTRNDTELTGRVETIADNQMTAADIYDMALSQVVGIMTRFPGMGFRDIGEEGDPAPVSGSGFIISTDGYILTNYHVIEMAHRSGLPIVVVLENGSEYTAEIVGFEASNDVALLKINAAGLSAAMIGNSDEMRVGERIYAVGNPLGDLAYTMTDGIVSALDRVVTVDSITIDAFQFSAAVNRGNSGGPIYNQRGEVIGIVTAKVIRGNVEGIGFAIPINDAMEIAIALIEDGYLSGRPLLGVTVQNVSPFDVEQYGKVQGVSILSINSGSAAETAGLEVDDIIVSIGDDTVISLDALRQSLDSYRAGDTTDITVWREGNRLTFSITFDEDMYAGRPDRPAPPPAPTTRP
ncbi:MAG: trypsin-like peptidase domain-containing protein [Oscillospiraceae bacterium]|nr:trypsin-like peptidase domain-containing protein [Oscillospiraceae bacterium]